MIEVTEILPEYEKGDLLYKQEVYKIIGCWFSVHRELGKGFSELVYKEALALELTEIGFKFEREKKFDILYKGIKLPRHYYCDFVVDDKIILEIKSQESLVSANISQTLNYLATTGLRLGC